MRIISINLNKRLGVAKAAHSLETWLQQRACDVLLVQEPWSRTRDSATTIRGYKAIGGTSSVFAWIKNHYAMPAISQYRVNWQQIVLNYINVHNVYLSAYSSSKRAAELAELHNEVMKNENSPLLIVGDFNLAPRPEDGLVGDKISSWTSVNERNVLNDLLSCQGLIDMTAPDRSGKVEYSIERIRAVYSTAFRCDLALVTDYIADGVAAVYDHSTRTGAAAFTDHSALIIDVPITLAEADLFSQDSTEECFARANELFQPHKTAMARSTPSKIAAELHATRFFETHGISSILDYGCGRGKDVLFYRSLGIEAYGYDPYPPFGWNVLPNVTFDLVTLVFVLNVLTDPAKRISVLRAAVAMVRTGGYLFVATRSPATIQKEAKLKGWKPYNDGYISHMQKRTFQKGISRRELELMARRVGLKIYEWRTMLGAGTTYVLARREPNAI